MNLKTFHSMMVYDEFGSKDYGGYLALALFIGFPLFLFIGLPLILIFMLG